MRVFRITLSVGDIDHATRFYQALLAQPGSRVSPGRQHFDLGQMVLACYAPSAEGDPSPPTPLSQPLHFAVHDLEAFYERATVAGGLFGPDDAITDDKWGERGFTCRDPFGNKLHFVEAGTEFAG